MTIFPKKIKMNTTQKKDQPITMTRSMDSTNYEPYRSGTDKAIFLCHNCNLVLLNRVKDEPDKTAYRCPRCHSYNSIKEK